MTSLNNARAARLLGTTALSMAALLGLTVPALAQTTAKPAQQDEASVETVTVTGIRASIRNSIGLKRAQEGVVEVVSAEDIGKLPDVSIAESLSRLPGLAVQRIDGRGQQLSIRGLGPDYTTALLNGREQVTTGDNRGVEFDQYPSELLSGVVVYKTPDAALIGQGLMGTADLRTIRPLKQPKRILAVGARYEFNEKGALNAGSEDKGYRFNVTFVDKFANDTLGVALGVATMSTPTQSERFNAWGYADVNATTKVIGGSKSYVQSNELKRTGVIGVVEYQPNADFNASLDVFYADFEEQQDLRGIELPLQWSSAQLQPGYTASNGLVTNGVFNGVKGVMRNDVNLREAEMMSIGLNMDFKITENWRGNFDLSKSSVDRKDVILETYAGTGENGVGATDNLGFSITGDNAYTFRPSLNYGNAAIIKLTSPQGWGTDAGAGRPFGQAGFLNMPSIEDELTAMRFSAKRALEWGDVEELEIGFNASKREKSKAADEFFIALKGGAASLAIPSGLLLGNTNLSYLGLGPMVSYDPQAMLGAGVYNQTRNTNADVITKAWSVDETVYTAYVKLSLDGDMGTIPYSGNMGLQIVKTEQESSGAAISGSNFVRNTSGTDYTEVLPSLNFKFDLTDGYYLRLAAARTLARPRMDQMSASQTFGRDNAKIGSKDPFNSYFSAGGGNPSLQPYITNGVDLSFEKYFGGSGYVSAAYFYKRIDQWVNTNASVIYDFSGFLNILTAAERAALGTPLGKLNAPNNQGKGFIKGWELAASIPFDLIHPMLDGFGATLSGAFTESEIRPDPNAGPIAVPGLSETVVNSSIYYEKNGFQARLSQRYRSDFLGEVTGFGAGRATRSVGEETVYDAQIGYEFQEGPMKGTSVVLQGYNLSDEPFMTYQDGDKRKVIDFQRYGTTYLVGVSYKF